MGHIQSFVHCRAGETFCGKCDVVQQCLYVMYEGRGGGHVGDMGKHCTYYSVGLLKVLFVQRDLSPCFCLRADFVMKYSVEVSAEYVFVKPKLLFKKNLLKCEYLQTSVVTILNLLNRNLKGIMSQVLFLCIFVAVRLNINNTQFFFLFCMSSIYKCSNIHGVQLWNTSVPLLSTGATSAHLLVTQQNGLRSEAIRLPLTCLVHCLRSLGDWINLMISFMTFGCVIPQLSCGKRYCFLSWFCVHKQPIVFKNEKYSLDDYNCLLLMNLLCHKFFNNNCDEAKMVQN